MKPGFQFHVARHIALQNLGKNFLAGLNQALGPARLLRLERGHLDGEFGGTLDVLQIDELPAFQLRAIGKVGVFGERVVLPAAGLVDGLTAPHSGGAVEVEEDVAARASRVLENEVAVEQDGFNFGEERVVAVDVRPARLHHADLRIGEVVDHLHQEIFGRDEVGVEDGDELALGRSSVLRRALRP